MGISGLLPFLDKASKKAHVAQFRGCTVAIDAYCWLHKGAFGCAEKLLLGQETDAYIQYCAKYIEMLKSYDIKPILVFDGQYLPAKKMTEQKRREGRKTAKKKALELLRSGQGSEARKFVIQSINVTHKMALAVIQWCRKNKIDCIVAPYEADAQLAYLNINKFVHFVITEDSDLLLFGCDKILFKMGLDGYGTLVQAQKINVCMKMNEKYYNFDKFRHMCILSGCDYLQSLPGIGLKKALKFLSLTANPDIYFALTKLPIYLKMPNLVMTDEYRKNFMEADATFKYQIVYDPVKRKLVPLNQKAPDVNPEHCKNAGEVYDEDKAFQLALGNVDPISYEKLDDWTPDSSNVASTSIWSKYYHKPDSTPRKKVSVATVIRTNTKVIEINEKEQIEYDIKLDNELKQYKDIEPITKPKQKTSDDELSPKLNKNGTTTVRNLRKLSRFERTVITSDIGATSRFFKPKEIKEDDKTESSSLLGSIDTFTSKKRCSEAELHEITHSHKKRILENSAVEVEIEESTEKIEIIDFSQDAEVQKENLNVNVDITNLDIESFKEKNTITSQMQLRSSKKKYQEKTLPRNQKSILNYFTSEKK